MAGTESLRLGNIVYSNCFPVHARLIDLPEPGDPVLVNGIPSYLNGLLDSGEIDVAPCSSIEYALHPDRYRIVPDLVIGSRGPVRSIIFLADREPQRLHNCRVAIPTASATSVLLLKVLLKLRWSVSPDFFWFDQASENPFARGAHAALFIGDVALRPDLFPAVEHRFDLGQEWWQQTGLPFAFAVWQVTRGEDASLHELHDMLVKSRGYAREHRSMLAARYSAHFGLPAELLDGYWADLSFQLDPAMIDGLRTFYQLAASIGELSAAPTLNWV